MSITLGRAAVVPAVILLISAVSAFGQEPATEETSQVLTNAAQVVKLSSTEVIAKHPVRLRGVVTFSDAVWKVAFVQDESAGVAVELGDQPCPEPGSLVEVHGESGPGIFAPAVLRPQLEILGRAPFPTPRQVPLDQLQMGNEDGQWVEADGIVRSAGVDDGLLILEIARSGQRLRVVTRDLRENNSERLVDAKVRVRGVCGGVFNDKGQLIGVQLLAPSCDEITVLRPPGTNSFTLPVSQIDGLFRYGSNAKLWQRARVQGVVTWIQPGQALSVQDETGGVLVQTRQQAPVQPGSRVDVVGFLTRGAVSPVLQDGVFRVTGQGDALKPRPMMLSDGGFGRCDAALVSVDALLLEAAQGQAGYTLSLQASNVVFNARLDGQPRLNLRPRSLLRLTGVCAVQGDRDGAARSFELLLRSAEDITVLQQPSWWTIKRILVAVAALLVIVFGSVAWLMMRQQRELIENASDIIYSQDLAGLFTSLNKTGERILGSSRKELAGKGFSKIVAPDQQERIREMDRKMAAREGVTAFELEVLTKNGERVILEVNSRPILRQGRLWGVEGIARDITERKRAEMRLRKQEEFIRQIIDADPNLIFVKDEAGRFTMVNRANAEFNGLTVEQMIGRTDADLNPNSAEVEKIRADDREIFKTGREKFIAEEKFTNNQGRTVWFQTIKRPFASPDGKTRQLLGVATDITERKQAEEELKRAKDAAEAAARAKGEFLANMSHEIRTPMNGIIGMTNLLLDTNLTEEQRDFGNTVKWSADGLLTIINDILDFSKMEAGKLHFETLNFDLREVIESTLEILSERASKKSLELASFVPHEISGCLRGDPSRLRQILLNLTGNALKFTEQGEVILNVSQEAETDQEVTLRFEITDTGIGISPEAQQRLFQPFTQADGSTTRKFGGTGLGLAISKQIVAIMGGQIGVRSVPGQGSTFWFTARFEKQPAPLLEAGPSLETLENVRVLVVDDNAVNRRILHHHVVAWRMQNGCASGAVEALEILQREAAAGRPYDLVILDLQMPEVDGLMLAHRIRSHPELARTKLLLLTSLGHHFKKEILDEAGLSACLVKPVRQSDLYNRLVEILAGARTVNPRGAAPARAAHDAPALLKSLRILLAEDNSVNQKVALRQLQKLGCRADAVSNGLEALAAVERNSYDVILMDCQMPEMDGYEATRQLRKMERTKNIRIIAITANAMQGDREKCLSAGMDDYVSKPVNIENLKAALERNSPNNPAEVQPQASAQPMLNQETLAQLKELGEPGEPNPLVEFIDLFLQDAPDCLRQLEAALQTKQVAEARRLAHSLKGSANNLGAEQLGAVCQRLEHDAKEGKLDSAPELLQRITRELESAKAALEQERAACLTSQAA